MSDIDFYYTVVEFVIIGNYMRAYETAKMHNSEFDEDEELFNLMIKVMTYKPWLIDMKIRRISKNNIIKTLKRKIRLKQMFMEKLDEESDDDVDVFSMALDIQKERARRKREQQMAEDDEK